MWWRDFCSSSVAALLLLWGAGAAAADTDFLTARCDREAAALLPGNPEGARARLEALPDTSTPECQAAMGELYLLEGNDFWAMRSLQAALAALPTADGKVFRRRVEWLLCVVLVRTEQWEDALAICSAQVGDDPSRNAMLDYYGGIAAFRAGDDLTAVARLQRRAWPPAFDASARRFLSLSIGRLAGVRPGLDLSLGSSVAYDSNALMTPEDPVAVGIVGEVDALKSAHWLQLGYRFKNVGRYVFSARANVFRSWHFAPLPEAVNATDLGASATVQRYGVVGRKKMAWEGRYSYRVTALDGGEATLEDGFFGFVESHTVSLGPSFWSAAGHGLSIRYAASAQRFAELVRNGLAHNLSVGEEFGLADNLRLAIAQGISFAQAGQPYQRWGATLGTFLAWQPAQQLTATLRGTGIYEDYFNSTGYFAPGIQRQDWSYVVRLEGEWAFGWGFALGPFGGVSGRHSSVESMTYDKWEAGLQLRWTYGAH
jgi:hypothetical protein